MNNNYTFTYKSKPTSENIYYMFQRFVTPIIISTTYEPYKEYWKQYEQILEIVKKWMSIYFNTNDLTKINVLKEFEEFDSLLADLLTTCLEIDTRYIEEIDIWHGEFLQLWKDAHTYIRGGKK